MKTPMIPQSTHGTELDDLIIFVEKIFDIRVPDADVKFLATAGGMVNWLQSNVLRLRPQKHATALLKRIAEDQQRPELVKGLDGRWRLGQITAIVGDIFRRRDRVRALPDLAEYVWRQQPQLRNAPNRFELFVSRCREFFE